MSTFSYYRTDYIILAFPLYGGIHNWNKSHHMHLRVRDVIVTKIKEAMSPICWFKSTSSLIGWLLFQIREYARWDNVPDYQYLVHVSITVINCMMNPAYLQKSCEIASLICSLWQAWFYLVSNLFLKKYTCAVKIYLHTAQNRCNVFHFKRFVCIHHWCN